MLMRPIPIFLLAVSLSVFLSAQTTSADTIRLTLSVDTIALDEVVVTERRTPAAAGRWSDMNPVELVTAGGTYGIGQADQPFTPRRGGWLCGGCRAFGYRGALYPAGGIPLSGTPARLEFFYLLAIQPGRAI